MVFSIQYIHNNKGKSQRMILQILITKEVICTKEEKQWKDIHDCLKCEFYGGLHSPNYIKCNLRKQHGN